MEEPDFLAAADAELTKMEAAISALCDSSVADFDYEMKPGGIIEIVFEDDSKIVVNRHVAACEIWVAARSGGFHFRPPTQADDAWIGTRDGESLAATLSRCFSEQAGVTLQLAW